MVCTWCVVYLVASRCYVGVSVRRKRCEFFFVKLHRRNKKIQTQSTYIYIYIYLFDKVAWLLIASYHKGLWCLLNMISTIYHYSLRKLIQYACADIHPLFSTLLVYTLPYKREIHVHRIAV